MRGVELVQESELTRSALEAARTVLRATYCAVAWRDDAVIATQGISQARAERLAPRWMNAALGHGSRASIQHRVEPVLGPDGEIRGALVADLRGGVRPGDARALMPVFAAHLALLRRTASYEALFEAGMQIQAVEADVDATLHLIVERARDLLGSDLAWMGLVNEEQQTLDMRVAVGARTEPFMRMQLRLGDGVGGVVVATRTPLAVSDYAAQRPRTPSRVSDAILGEGIGSMLCCPMLRGEKVVGALYVGSRRPRAFPAIEVALTSALAAQGAVAIENGRLYEALAEQNRLLEGSFAVHRALTDAALTGTGRAHILAEVARLIGAGVVLEQDISAPFVERHGLGEPTLGVPVEDFGRLRVCGLETLTPLQEKALEHAATVLALELVKERAQQRVEWQLQGDLLSELLDGPPTPSLAARARRHGVDLTRAHQIIAVDAELDFVRRATGRRLVHRDAALVCTRGALIVVAARDAEPVVRALGGEGAGAHPPSGERVSAGRAPLVAIGVSDPSTELPAAFKQAAACVRLAQSRGGGVVRAATLGPLRFVLDAPEISHVRAVVQEQLGPLLAHSGRADLLATLRAFVAADGNVALTAKQCFIHKNTLRYRLTRLTDVLGRDPAEPDAKFHLRMAFDLVDLFDGLGVDLLAPEHTRTP